MHRHLPRPRRLSPALAALAILLAAVPGQGWALPPGPAGHAAGLKGADPTEESAQPAHEQDRPAEAPAFIGQGWG